MAIFKVGSKDYSAHVVDKTYSINEIDKFKEWDDGLGNTHRDQRPSKHNGTVQLAFKTMNEYKTFLTDLSAAKYNSENQYTLTIKANNNSPDTEVTIHAFVDFEANRALKGNMSEYIEPIELTITES